jgi:hypothetical protein
MRARDIPVPKWTTPLTKLCARPGRTRLVPVNWPDSVTSINPICGHAKESQTQQVSLVPRETWLGMKNQENTAHHKETGGWSMKTSTTEAEMAACILLCVQEFRKGLLVR